MNAKRGYLIESALLGQGLPGISDAELLAIWPEEICNITWLDEGEIVVGGMPQFLNFRQKQCKLMRINRGNFAKYQESKASGFLTASGTMLAAESMGIHLVVTCGMGGISREKGAPLCTDMPALAEMETTLIATSPKDMLNVGATLQWFDEHGVKVFGVDTDCCTGYMFRSCEITLSGGAVDRKRIKVRPRQLLLNPIPMQSRISDLTILEAGNAAGLEALARGEEFHPAANREIDRLSHGYATEIQIVSLIENAKLAEEIAGGSGNNE